MTKDDAIVQTDYYLRGMGLPSYSDLIAFVQAVASEAGSTHRADTLAEVIQAAQALAQRLPGGAAPITIYEQDPGKTGMCRYCGLPKDFHKTEGNVLVCHSPDSRPMPL
ncbi:MAG TPA: hypothetical protein PKV17_10465 [Aquabacterium sp.]|nr:hypothetical protein [Aquabacterium sp.]